MKHVHFDVTDPFTKFVSLEYENMKKISIKRAKIIKPGKAVRTSIIDANELDNIPHIAPLPKTNSVKHKNQK